MKKVVLSLLLPSLFLLNGCYSLSGISIDPSAKYFFVELFDNKAEIVEPTLATEYTELLKDKIRNASRLILNENNPDISFTGSITRFQITAEAPQPGATTAFNRLTISLNISFENARNEKDNWSKTFTRFANFAATDDFNSVKQSLFDEIGALLMEDIFNEAFAKNW